jgi:hypothetical protein
MKKKLLKKYVVQKCLNLNYVNDSSVDMKLIKSIFKILDTSLNKQ